MKTNHYVLLVILAALSLTASGRTAQRHATLDSAVRKGATVDTLVADRYLAALDSLRRAYLEWKYEGGDTLSNPYLFQMLGAPTYYDSAAHQQFSTDGQSAPAAGAVSTGVNQRISSINNLLTGMYATQPWLIGRMDPSTGYVRPAIQPADTVEAKPIPDEVPVVAPVEENKEPERFLSDLDAFTIKVKRPNFWTLRGNFNVQLQQTHISDNWYQGGSNSFSANGQFTFEANYNNKQKITWDNKLEARLGMQTTNEYNLNRFKPTTDLVRFTSKLGLKAVKKWYYMLSLQTWTQMTQNREYYMDGAVEKYRVSSDFMSPFEAVLSLGMDYKLEKNKFKISANISPLAVDYKHVSRTLYKDGQTLYKKFGLDHHDKFDFGSTFTINTSWAICPMLSWSNRLYFFTSYHRTTVEFENTFSLKVNKYLSTKLFLYPRFDDGVARGEHDTYFQFKEFFSFGLDVSF